MCGIVVIFAALGTVGSAQIGVRESAPPARTAAAEPWYASREPIFVDGAYYERAGAAVFFDGKTMVPIGSIEGVHVYADVTLEPHSVVFVPMGRGLMQPYERRRAGDLAGTTGSRAPSFPVEIDSDVRQERTASEDFTSMPVDMPDDVSAEAEATSGLSRIASGRVWTVRTPVGSRGIWIPVDGHVWISAGRAEPLDPARLVQTGTYAGFPVYRDAARDDVVFVPVVEGGLVTPYRRTEDPADR